MNNGLLGFAIYLAAKAHKDDLDKGGKPYILHPLRLMMRLDQTDPELLQIAVMHDVFEDHPELYTLKDLEEFQFSPRVINALTLLTHKKGVPYEDYIKLIGTNRDATIVKLEDLKDNSDITRLKGISEKDLQRTQRYHKAFMYLTNLLNSSIYQ